ncbi:hypothetical protein M3Y99_00781200 [Aphelenchoides fujianensis]|nr:hypothetical protein M3Y99_00781200 [Aphelenchoides fujianensis]
MSTLVGSAVFLILAEHAFTLETKEVPLDTPKEIVHVLGACAYLDAAAAILHYNAFGLGRLMYLSSMLACTGYLLINPRKGSFEVPIEQLVEIGEETFFYDLARPLNALGRRGWFQLLFVSSRMLVGLMPYLSNKLLVRDLFVLGQCASAWFLLTSPLMVGGLVHSMKQTVRAVVERRMKERIDEVEQEEKQKGGRRSKEQIEAEVVREYAETRAPNSFETSGSRRYSAASALISSKLRAVRFSSSTSRAL